MGIALVVVFYKDNVTLTALLGLALVCLLKLYRKKYDVHFFVTAAVVGPVTEIIAIAFGVWYYSNPSFLGIPIWLPLAWGFFVLLIKRIVEIFVKFEIRK